MPQPEPAQPFHHGRPRRARASSTSLGEDWLAVFYDVVTGIAIIELGAFLSAAPGPNLARYLSFVGLLVPIWWVWMGWTVYCSRFEADDAPHRLLTFVQMLATAAMVVQIRSAQSDSAIFAAAFVVARLSLLALYLRVRGRIPGAAPIVSVYLRGFGLGLSLWAVSIPLPSPARQVLWAAGVAVDLATPWHGRKALEQMPLAASHFFSRLGAFTSTVLAVAMAGVIGGVSELHWNLRAVLAALLGFSLAVCIWWIRAELLGRTEIGPRSGAGLQIIFINLLVVVGLATLGVGVQLAIRRASTGMIAPATFWLLGGGAAIWLAAQALANFWLLGLRSRRMGLAYAFALLTALAQPVLGPRLPSPLAMALLVGAFVVLLLSDSRPHLPPPSGEPEARA